MQEKETIFVRPQGQNTDPNTVTTLQAAAALSRRLRAGRASAVTVHVAAGRYFLTQPLTLGPDDSDVYWQADGEVILTGAMPLGTLDWTAYRDGIFVAGVPAGLAIDQLFVNGVQQTMARYPDYDPDAVLQGSTSAAEIRARSAGWKNPAGGYLRALHDKKWGGNSYRILGKADNQLGLCCQWVGDNNRGSGMHPQYLLVENIFEELDAEGEWYYDKDGGKLYCKPAAGVELASVTLEAAVTAELLRVAGVPDGTPAKNITFDGFTLENTARTLFCGRYVPLQRSDWCVVRAGALFIQDAEGITFQNGTLRQIGGNAVFISGHAQDVRIVNNEITNVGASGVLVAGLPDACRQPSFWEYEAPLVPETPAGRVHPTTITDPAPGPLREHYPKACTVACNHIQNVGIWEKQSSHVAISTAADIRVLHNTLHVGPRAGVNIGDGCFGGHEIACNDIFDVQRETDDHGMFNSWGRDRFWSLGGYDTLGQRGAQKEPYSLLDCVKPITIHDNRMHFGGRVDGGSTFGIDLDDGSSHYEIYNNLCLNMGIKLREGFHRHVYNNILVNDPLNLHCTCENAFDRIHGNLILKGAPYSLAATGEERFAVSRDVIDGNWFYDLGGAITLPDFWRRLGYEANSLLGAEDPQFRDPAHNDYTVQNTAAMAKVGFCNFSMRQFGKPGCRAVCPLYQKTAPDSGETLATARWQGAVLSALDDAIMSSTGAGKREGVYLQAAGPDSAAARGGLQTADVIQTVNGRAFDTVADFLKLVAASGGGAVRLGLVRHQRPLTLDFTEQPLAPQPATDGTVRKDDGETR